MLPISESEDTTTWGPAKTFDGMILIIRIDMDPDKAKKLLQIEAKPIPIRPQFRQDVYTERDIDHEIVQRTSPDLALWLETELQNWLAPSVDNSRTSKLPGLYSSQYCRKIRDNVVEPSRPVSSLQAWDSRISLPSSVARSPKLPRIFRRISKLSTV